MSNSLQKSQLKDIQSNIATIDFAIDSKKTAKLNKTAYLFNNSPNNINQNSSRKSKASPSQNQGENGLPTINDEDYENIKTSQNVNQTENVNKSGSLEVGAHSVIRNSKHRVNGNAIYDIRRGRKSHNIQFSQNSRLHSHQTKTKVRIQGKRGMRTEKYVNIQRSLEEQKRFEDQKRTILKARERHKIQERIERYREEKIQREIELLEEAKRLEQEERNREKIREDRRYLSYNYLSYCCYTERSILIDKERNLIII